MLQALPVALEGAGGDSQTYKTACLVRDLAISEPLCVDLMLRYWNPRCQPPWDSQELSQKVKNAYNYALTQAGANTPEADFESIQDYTEEYAKNSKDNIEFISIHTLINDHRPIDWLIKRYFEMDTVNLFYGESGALKSFISIDIALHTALGLKWAGQDVKQGTVFYLAGEGHGGIRRRMQAWAKHKGIIIETNTPLFISKSSVRLDKKENVNKLIMKIKEMTEKHDKPSLIIIDTLATAFGEGDENNTKDMGIFLNHINNSIRRDLGCSIIIVHHTGHKEKFRPRGAYALFAGVDSCYQITKHQDDDIFVCLKKPNKMKDSEPPDDTWFRAERMIIDFSDDEEIVSLAVKHEPYYSSPVKETLSGAKQKFVYKLLETDGEMTKKEIKSKFLDKHSKEDAIQLSREQIRSITSSISRAIEKLHKRGIITCNSDKYSIPNTNKSDLEEQEAQ